MAGTMSDGVKSDGGKRDPPYPGEAPTGPEFDSWLRIFSNEIKGTDYPAGIQGKIPPSLIGLAVQVPMEDIEEQQRADVETVTEARARTTFNLKIRQSIAEQAARKEAYDAGILKLKNALAGRLIAMLTAGKAPGRLAKLKSAHMIGPKADDMHDGFAMYRDLLKGRTTKDGPTAKREAQCTSSGATSSCRNGLQRGKSR